MQIDVKTEFVPLTYELEKDIPAGIDVRVNRPLLRRSFDSQDVAIAVITVAANIPTGLLTAWLWEKLRDKPRTTITINKKDVRMEQGEIARVIEEQIKIEQGN